MARALVTGITGQDGSYLAEQLAAEGTEVHGMVHDADPAGAEFRVGHPGVHLHAGDLADQAGLAQLVRDVEPDELYNLAGISSVAYSWEQPVLTAELTGVAAAVLFEAALALQEHTGRTGVVSSWGDRAAWPKISEIDAWTQTTRRPVCSGRARAASNSTAAATPVSSAVRTGCSHEYATELIPAKLYSSSGSTSRTSWARPAWSARSPACRCTPGCPTRNSAPAGSASCTMPCTSVPSAASCSAR